MSVGLLLLVLKSYTRYTHTKKRKEKRNLHRLLMATKKKDTGAVSRGWCQSASAFQIWTTLVWYSSIPETRSIDVTCLSQQLIACCIVRSLSLSARQSKQL